VITLLSACLYFLLFFFFIFCAVRVVSKESRRLVLPRTSCYCRIFNLAFLYFQGLETFIELNYLFLRTCWSLYSLFYNKFQHIMYLNFFLHPYRLYSDHHTVWKVSNSIILNTRFSKSLLLSKRKKKRHPLTRL
jgi:hypothetical protein